MDAGCYAINCIRWLAGDTIAFTSDLKNGHGSVMSTHVIDAKATLAYPQVDSAMQGTVQFKCKQGPTSAQQLLQQQQEEEEYQSVDLDEDKKGKGKVSTKDNDKEQRDTHALGEDEGTPKEKEQEKRGGKDDNGDGDIDTTTVEATFSCSLFSFPEVSAQVDGTEGRLEIVNFIAPHFYHSFKTVMYPPMSERGTGGKLT